MGEIISFLPQDPGSMDRDGLLVLLANLREQVARLDEEEPEDMQSEAYEQWGSRHEDLEDQIDEIMELLEEV